MFKFVSNIIIFGVGSVFSQHQLTTYLLNRPQLPQGLLAAAPIVNQGDPPAGKRYAK